MHGKILKALPNILKSSREREQFDPFIFMLIKLTAFAKNIHDL